MDSEEKFMFAILDGLVSTVVIILININLIPLITNPILLQLSSPITTFIVLSLGIFLFMRVANAHECNGTDLIEGCGDRLRPFTLYEFYFKFALFNSDIKHYYGYYKDKKSKKYEMKFCCEKCLEKHEAVRIANILTADMEDEDSYTLVYRR